MKLKKLFFFCKLFFLCYRSFSSISVVRLYDNTENKTRRSRECCDKEQKLDLGE